MFIIGCNYTLPCEVYDKVSNQFSSFEPPGRDMMSIQNFIEQPYCVGDKVVLITGWYENLVTFCLYDVDKNIWSTEEKYLM